MALKPELEEVLKSIPDEKYRQTMREALEANPNLAGGWLRQADYDRQLNNLKAQKTKLDNWWEGANTQIKTAADKAKEMEAKATEASEQIKILEAKIQSGQFSSGDENAMGQEITKLQKQIQDLSTSLGTQFIDKAKYEEDIQKRAQGVVTFVSENIFSAFDLAERYRDDFGKRFTPENRQKLITFAHENELSLEDAYNRMFHDDIKKKEREDIRKEVETEIKTRTGMPVGDGNAPLGGGPLQQRLAQKTVDGLPTDAPMDAVAAAAGAALRQEGKM